MASDCIFAEGAEVGAVADENLRDQGARDGAPKILAKLDFVLSFPFDLLSFATYFLSFTFTFEVRVVGGFSCTLLAFAR